MLRPRRTRRDDSRHSRARLEGRPEGYPPGEEDEEREYPRDPVPRSREVIREIGAQRVRRRRRCRFLGKVVEVGEVEDNNGHVEDPREPEDAGLAVGVAHRLESNGHVTLVPWLRVAVEDASSFHMEVVVDRR